MNGVIRIGVVGTGNMGRNYVRILSNEKNLFSFMSIYDTSIERATFLSDIYGVKIAPDYESLLDEVDAVVIAAPSSLHRDLGLIAAKKGIHALIEKPLAMNSVEAFELCEAYKKSGKTLLVGHVERFNPVVGELKKILFNKQIIAINAKRYSSFDERMKDTDVVFDLMIHDIDLVCNLLCGTSVKSINSVGSKVVTKVYDFVESIIKFNDGTIAGISASRVSETKVREILVHTSDSYIVADLLGKTLNITKNVNMVVDAGNSFTYRQDSLSQRVFVPIIEPLVAELYHFADCINEGTAAFISGKDALKAIEIAERIISTVK